MERGELIRTAVSRGAMILLGLLLVSWLGRPAYAEPVGAESPEPAEVSAESSTKETSEDAEEVGLPPILLLDEAERKKLEAEAVENERLLKKPTDFAPPERIVMGRDETAFRKTGTLLSTARGTTPLVDQNQLVNRRLAMYGGNSFNSSLAYPDRPRRVLKAVQEIVRKTHGGQLGGVWGKSFIILLVLGLSTFYFLIRRGLLHREDKHKKPSRKKKEPRLKVTLTPQ